MEPPAVQGISIHAPRVGSDLVVLIQPRHQLVFQSTLPVWGATLLRLSLSHEPLISIHAPRVGSDP